MDALMGTAAPALERAMRFRMAREAVLAGNVANADTPGYRRRELHFDGMLDEQLAGLERTHPGHLPGSGAGDGAYRLELGPRGTRPDGNGVDLDAEVIQAHRNAGAFSDQAAIYARLSALTRIAVTGS